MDKLKLVELQTIWSLLQGPVLARHYLAQSSLHVLDLRIFVWERNCFWGSCDTVGTLGDSWVWHSCWVLFIVFLDFHGYLRRSLAAYSFWNSRSQLTTGGLLPTTHCSCRRTVFFSPWYKSSVSGQTVCHLPTWQKNFTSPRARWWVSDGL